MKGIVVIACLVIVVAVQSVVIARLLVANARIRREARKAAGNASLIIEKERENEERKKELHTGNAAADFGNSIDLLQKLSMRT